MNETKSATCQRQPELDAAARRSIRRLMAAVLLIAQLLAHAHSVTGAIGGFLSGFMHPLTGPDHIAAMVAVGRWGAWLGAAAMCLLPVIFPLVMAHHFLTNWPHFSLVLARSALQTLPVDNLNVPEEQPVPTAATFRLRLHTCPYSY